MIALGGCATTDKAPEPIVLVGHHFAYSIEGRENVQLIQVFDDGSRTYLQFRQPPPAPVAIEGGSDRRPVGYLSDGPYLVVEGIYNRLEVSIGDRAAEVRKIAAGAELVPPAAAPPVAVSGTAQR